MDRLGVQTSRVALLGGDRRLRHGESTMAVLETSGRPGPRTWLSADQLECVDVRMTLDFHLN